MAVPWAVEYSTTGIKEKPGQVIEAGAPVVLWMCLPAGGATGYGSWQGWGDGEGAGGRPVPNVRGGIGRNTGGFLAV